MKSLKDEGKPPLRAAIYARYSTDKQSETSIKDQIRACADVADAAGWSVVKEFCDEGISGAAVGNRPGFQAMLAAAKADEFDVLIAFDMSRIARSVDLVKACERLAFVGKQVVTRDGLDTNTEGWEMLATVGAAVAQAQRKATARAVHASAHRKAKNGAATGGLSFGYEVVPGIGEGTDKPLEQRLRKNEVTAAVVINVFEWFASGWTPRRIADELNKRGVPSPGASWATKKRAQPRGSWTQTTIYGDPAIGTGILNNDLYRGLYVWNRRRWVKDPDTGRRVPRNRPEKEWTSVPVPSLRILSDELWDRVKAAQRRASAERGERVRLGLRAAQASGGYGQGPKYLFSGLLTCGKCGANFTICSATSYGCSRNLNGGDGACDNRIRVPRRIVEARLIEPVRFQLYSAEALEEFRKRTAYHLQQRAKGAVPERNELEERLAELEQAIKNIIANVRAGLVSPSVMADLAKAEAEKAQAERELDGLRMAKPAETLTFLPRLTERLQAVLGNLPELMGRDVQRAREQLRRLLGSIPLHPEGRHLKAELRGSWIHALELAGADSARVREVMMVAGEGFEPSTFGL